MKASLFCIFAFLIFWSDKARCYPANAKIITVHVKLNIVNIKNSVIQPVTLKVAEGTTAFQILQLAAKQNPCYKAEYKIFPKLGRFITSICCVEQDPKAKLYWLIYVNGRPAKVGVDNLKPKCGARLTFKYQKV